MTNTMPAVKRSSKVRWLVPMGLIIGAFLGWWLGKYLILILAEQQLLAFNSSLLKRANEIALEVGTVLDEVLTSDEAFCSATDLNTYRQIVFRSRYVKDIGRLENNQLICTTGLGRFSKPFPLPLPDYSAENGVQVFVDAALLIDKADKSLVVQKQNANVVIDPRAFQGEEFSYFHYAIFLVDPSQQRVLRSFGRDVAIDFSSIIEQVPYIHNERLIVSSCTKTLNICTVSVIFQHEILAHHGYLLLAVWLLGALGGGALGLAIASLLVRNQNMEYQLRRDLRRDKLFLEYQPIFDLQRITPVGAEALVRWIDDSGQRVRPDIFIALAEERGFISEVTQFVMRRAAHDMNDILRRQPDFFLSLNISAEDLSDETLIQSLKHHFIDEGIPPNQIVTELTERQTTDHADLAARLQKLRNLGFKIALDDFGTGQSNLSYLQQLPVDRIKIDQCFTQTVGTQAVCEQIVPHIMEMAKELQVGVIAEGFETQTQISYFQGFQGCLGQGHFYSRSLSPEDLLQLLRGTESVLDG